MPLPKYAFVVPCLLGAAGLFTARLAGDGTPGFYVATVITAIVYALTWWYMGSRRAFAGPHVASEIARGVAIGAVTAGVAVSGLGAAHAQAPAAPSHRPATITAALPVVGRGAERTGPSGRGSSTDHERTESWTSAQTIDPPTGVLPVTFAADEDVTRSRIPVRLAMPGVVLAAATLVLGLAGQGLWTLTDVAAQGLLDPARYIEAVLAP